MMSAFLELFGVMRADLTPGPPPETVIGNRDPRQALVSSGPLTIWAEKGKGGAPCPALSALCNRDSACLALARLDYPKESVARLGLNPNDGLNDADLLCRSYASFGPDGVTKATGDWVLASWDKKAGIFRLFRDHNGQQRLFHTMLEGCIIFSPDIRQLLALRGLSREPDLTTLAMLHLLGFSEKPTHRTFYRDIRTITPGHVLVVDANGSRVEPYWRPEDIPDIHLARDDDYVDAFTGFFRAAVRSRLPARGSVGVTLSAGLDSGSVAWLAARELAGQGRRLTAFTSVPRFNVDGLTTRGNFGDEGPLSQATALAGDMEHVLIDAPTPTIVGAIRTGLDLCAQPVHAAANAYWLLAIMQACRDRNISVLLTGQSGNATISRAGGAEERLRGLLAQGRLGLFTRELLATGAAHNNGRRRIPKTLLLKTLQPRAFKRWSVTRELRGPFWRDYSPMNRDFLEKIVVEEGLRNEGYTPPKLGLLTNREVCRTIIELRFRSPVHIQDLARHYGIDVRDPTCDTRLTEFCLGIPDDQYFQGGQGKRLIRRAMAGKLPDEVLFNPRKGRQAADLIPRLRETRDEVREALAQIHESRTARELLDLTRMETLFERIMTKADPKLTFEIHAILLKGLMTGLFLAGCDNKS